MTSAQRILLVDDDVGFTEVLKLMLETVGGHQVHVENDAKHAVTAAKVFRPDLVLLDVLMPGGNGGQVASRIRSDPSLSNLPIVFLTAVLSHGLVVDSHELNIAGSPCLTKPFRFQQLAECIERALSKT